MGEKYKIWLGLKLVAILLISPTSGLFLQQPLLNKMLLFFTTLSLFFHLNFKTPVYKYIFLICFISLTYIQISSTNIQNTYSFNDHQKYINQNRLDQYPPSLARVGNIIENRLDSPIVYRLRQNLFDSFDFVNYFKNFFLPIFFIPFLIGLYKLLKNPNKLVISTTLISIFILSIVGSHGSYGPIIIFPFITIIISYFSCEK